MQRDIYCVKCKMKVPHVLKQKEEGHKKGTYYMTRASNSRKQAKGRCVNCGTGTSVFVKE